jgi:hypothetical protein
MRITMIVTLGMLISFTCFAMFWFWPKAPLKKKYILDFSPVSNLKKDAFDEKFLKKMLEEMNEIKIKEYKWGGPKGNKYTEYHFIDESGGSDLRIEIIPRYSTEEAIEEFEMEKSFLSRYKYIYENKNKKDTLYYGTYLIQFRNDPEGGTVLMDSYSTDIGIQNNTIFIKMIDYSGNTDKSKIQKYINMFGEAASKE